VNDGRGIKKDYAPSVMSSTSPLSPKHWAKRHPPEPEGSSMMYLGGGGLSVVVGSLTEVSG